MHFDKEAWVWCCFRCWLCCFSLFEELSWKMYTSLWCLNPVWETAKQRHYSPQKERLDHFFFLPWQHQTEERYFWWDVLHSMNNLLHVVLHQMRQLASDRGMNITRRSNRRRRLQIKRCKYESRASSHIYFRGCALPENVTMGIWGRQIASEREKQHLPAG